MKRESSDQLSEGYELSDAEVRRNETIQNCLLKNTFSEADIPLEAISKARMKKQNTGGVIDNELDSEGSEKLSSDLAEKYRVYGNGNEVKANLQTIIEEEKYDTQSSILRNQKNECTIKKFTIGAGAAPAQISKDHVVPAFGQLQPSPVIEKRYFVNMRNLNDSNPCLINDKGQPTTDLGNKNKKLPNTITEPTQQVYRVVKPGSTDQNVVKVDVVQETQEFENPQLMNLHTIVNYQYLKRRNKLYIRLAVLRIPINEQEDDHIDVYIENFPELKMYIIEMIYGFLKDFKYLSIDFQDISKNFSSKCIDGYCKAIKCLCQKLKTLGATRPYYVCEKILELYEMYKNMNKAEAIIIDIDQFNEIWSLYSTLIEMTIQYFLFLDFEFDVLVLNYKVFPPNMQDMNDIARYQGRFRKIGENLMVNQKFRIQIQDNQVHCLYFDEDGKIFETVEERVQIQNSIKITPQNMQNESARVLRSTQDKNEELEEFLNSNIHNMSMVEMKENDEDNYYLMHFQKFTIDYRQNSNQKIKISGLSSSGNSKYSTKQRKMKKSNSVTSSKISISSAKTPVKVSDSKFRRSMFFQLDNTLNKESDSSVSAAKIDSEINFVIESPVLGDSVKAAPVQASNDQDINDKTPEFNPDLHARQQIIAQSLNQIDKVLAEANSHSSYMMIEKTDIPQKKLNNLQHTLTFNEQTVLNKLKSGEINDEEYQKMVANKSMFARCTGACGDESIRNGSCNDDSYCNIF